MRLFGEDNTSVQPDEFFGVFDTFLTAFIEAKADNENNRKRREEEEKRARQDAEVKWKRNRTFVHPLENKLKMRK